MLDLLFWLYLTNAVFLIVHEIDSAYWKEWELFGLPGGIALFLILHFPILFIILYGLVLVFSQAYAGMIFSLILSGGGIFAFSIHTYFIKKGHHQFNTPISLFVIITIAILSVIQAVLTIYLVTAAK
jgi:hypothetical protein